MIASSLLDAVVAAGLTAPSGDNCQPWRILTTPRGFRLYIARERSCALLDVDELASRIATGAFLEAARLAAAARGHALTWLLDPDPDDPDVWADITVEAIGDITPDPLEALLRARHTNRARFDRSPLAAHELAAISAEVAAPLALSVHHDRDEIATIAAAVGAAERVRAGIKIAHEDLHRWMRWTPDAATATADGLDVRTLGLSWGERFALRLLAPWRRMSFALRLGAARANGRWARRLCASASAVAVISVPDLDGARGVAAGRALQRMWLRITQLGLQASPLMALPLLAIGADRGLADLAPWRAPLRAGIADISRVARLPASHTPLILLRIGRAEPAPVRALRRSPRALMPAEAG